MSITILYTSGGAARRFDTPQIIHEPTISVPLPEGSDSFHTIRELPDGTTSLGFCERGVVSFELVAISGHDSNSNRCLETIQLAEWKTRTYDQVAMLDDDLVACTLRESPYVELFSLTNRCCMGDMNLLDGVPREVVRLKKYPEMLVAVMDTSLVFWDSSNQLRIISKLNLDHGEVTSNLCELEDGIFLLGVKQGLIAVSPKKMKVIAWMNVSTHKVDVIFWVTEIRKDIVALSTWLKKSYNPVVKVFGLDMAEQQQQNVKFLFEVHDCEKQPIVKFAEGMFLVIPKNLWEGLYSIEGWNDRGERWLRINAQIQTGFRASTEWVKVLSDGKVAYMTLEGTLNIYDCDYKG